MRPCMTHHARVFNTCTWLLALQLGAASSVPLPDGDKKLKTAQPVPLTPLLLLLLLLVLAASCASCTCNCCLSACAADNSRCSLLSCAWSCDTCTPSPPALPLLLARLLPGLPPAAAGLPTPAPAAAVAARAARLSASAFSRDNSLSWMSLDCCSMDTCCCS